jgi:hypothetical protein
MRNSSFIIVLLVIVVAGCVQKHSKIPLDEHSGVVGTWQLISVDGKPPEQTSYTRFYPDGTVVAWPPRNNWPINNASFSQSHYHLQAGNIIIEKVSGTGYLETHMEIKNDEMILSPNEVQRFIYHRIVPSLEPGKFNLQNSSH